MFGPIRILDAPIYRWKLGMLAKRVVMMIVKVVLSHVYHQFLTTNVLMRAQHLIYSACELVHALLWVTVPLAALAPVFHVIPFVMMTMISTAPRKMSTIR